MKQKKILIKLYYFISIHLTFLEKLKVSFTEL